MGEVTYRVEGMTCGGCVSSVTRALERLGSEVEVRVSLDAQTATLRGPAEESEVKRVIEAAGFGFGGRVSTGVVAP